MLVIYFLIIKYCMCVKHKRDNCSLNFFIPRLTYIKILYQYEFFKKISALKFIKNL